MLATSTNTRWLHSDGAGWLVAWLADKRNTGGVPLAPAVGGDLKGNCTAPGVHVRWDFAGAWEAIVLEASHTSKPMQSYVDKLTLEKWRAADAVHHYGAQFEAATPEQRTPATLHFLELHMQRTMEAA